MYHGTVTDGSSADPASASTGVRHWLVATLLVPLAAGLVVMADCCHKEFASERRCDAIFCWSTQTTAKAKEVVVDKRTRQVMNSTPIYYCDAHHYQWWTTHAGFWQPFILVVLGFTCLLAPAILKISAWAHARGRIEEEKQSRADRLGGRLREVNHVCVVCSAEVLCSQPQSEECGACGRAFCSPCGAGFCGAHGLTGNLCPRCGQTLS